MTLMFMFVFFVFLFFSCLLSHLWGHEKGTRDYLISLDELPAHRRALFEHCGGSVPCSMVPRRWRCTGTSLTHIGSFARNLCHLGLEPGTLFSSWSWSFSSELFSSFNQTCDLVLTYVVEVEHISVFQRNPMSDSSWITFEFMVKKTSLMSLRVIPALTPWPCVCIESCHYNLSPAEGDSLAEGAAFSLRIALDTVTPLKKKILSQRTCVPWCNLQIRTRKQKA